MTSDNPNIKENVSSERVRSELNNLAESIEVIMRTLKDMETQIRESQHTLPTAGRQLGEISTQTEAAAHNMLDKAERIIEHQEIIENLSDKLARLATEPDGRGGNEFVEITGRIAQMASDSKNHAFLIMDILQFQDVTSHQMEHASELLKEVERRLHHLQDLSIGAGITDNDTLTGPSSDSESLPARNKDQKEIDDIFSRMIETGT